MLPITIDVTSRRWRLPVGHIAVLLALFALVATATPVSAEPVRIATYNIKYLTADERIERLNAVRSAIEAIDADIIALQEIKDRAALEAVFDPEEWLLVIDDESGNRQDLAVAVRRPLTILGNLNADDEDFLFSFEDNTWFPVRRDILHVEVEIPGYEVPVNVLVAHLKSRVGGRASNDYRRAGAAMRLVDVIDSRFDGLPVILLGDFNDNPDDRSMNILETGDVNAQIEKENEPGEFMQNLTERLLLEGGVTNSLNTMRIDTETGKVIAIDTNSRNRNYDKRDTNAHTGNILFDQILTTPTLTEYYVRGSVKIFDGAENIGASDHLPVYADFDFSDRIEIGPMIVELLPNPIGSDSGNERISLENFSATATDMTGWRIEDLSGRRVALDVTLEANERLDIIIPKSTVTLNNRGDEIMLIDADDVERHRIIYTADDVEAGAVIKIDIITVDPDDGAGPLVTALLPNPAGTDAGNESLTFTNFSTSEQSVNGWYVEDRSGNRQFLTGTIGGQESVTFVIPDAGSGRLTLNNNGDELVVVDGDGAERQRVTYTRSQVSSGVEITVDP